jgi:hypothetical protein
LISEILVIIPSAALTKISSPKGTVLIGSLKKYKIKRRIIRKITKKGT